MNYDIVIVGGGIVGLATAYFLRQKLSDRYTIAVLEKEKELGFHQTGHNSGVIHSGIYYKPGSYRAKLCVQGRRALVKFAKEHHIPHEVCGKIIVAKDETEVPYLETIYQRGIENQIEGVSLISSEQIKEFEPYCVGVKAIHVSCTGIIDYKVVAHKYAEIFVSKGGIILTNQEVKGFERKAENTLIFAENNTYAAKYVIACGGLQSDRLALLYGLKPLTRIVGFRGEYYELLNKEKVKNLIYPVPNPKFPWLGVHFTRMINGEVECGPNAVFAFKREGYTKTAFSWKDTIDALRFRGFRKLTTKHFSYGVKEQWRSLSKRAFLKSLQGLIPSLTMEEIHPGRAGVRALALHPDGSIADDFIFEQTENSIHVLNAPSPAATASLAIGDTISQMAIEKFGLNG
ncbi:MAG: L-2-hydroxyglutarate oxidase [Bacteroidia bacterium]|nr:L-2-hydroxyglutarate oxidase [Bacteroidia bacterium]MDW8301889.1 L-2-hydroxyglutarate oxidase [Bacteroidia bacterium]